MEIKIIDSSVVEAVVEAPVIYSSIEVGEIEADLNLKSEKIVTLYQACVKVSFLLKQNDKPDITVIRSECIGLPSENKTLSVDEASVQALVSNMLLEVKAEYGIV